MTIGLNPKDMEENRAYFSSTRLNGVMLIDISENQSSEDDIYERSNFKFEYASGDEPVRHFTPGTDAKSFSGRKRA